MIGFFKKIRAGLFVAVLGLSLAGGVLAPRANAAVVALSSIEAGDLIRGESLSAVYYMGADGFRYVFPNDKCYFTWYSNFDSVKWISDSDMTKLQIGGNVTYKPGVKMVKITSNPTVYAIQEDGSLAAITSESQASSLYGSSWNTKIDDVADAFFGNYTIDSSASLSGYSASSVTAAVASINSLKGLGAPEDISIESSGFSPISVTIHAGETVRFTNNDSTKHAVMADDLTWGAILEVDGQFVKRFNTAGTYTFFDSYDSGNTGAIYVE